MRVSHFGWKKNPVCIKLLVKSKHLTWHHPLPSPPSWVLNNITMKYSTRNNIAMKYPTWFFPSQTVRAQVQQNKQQKRTFPCNNDNYAHSLHLQLFRKMNLFPKFSAYKWECVHLMKLSFSSFQGETKEMCNCDSCCHGTHITLRFFIQNKSRPITRASMNPLKQPY